MAHAELHEYFLFSCLWHQRIIYRASGVKLVLCCHRKGCRDLSAEHSMLITVGYSSQAHGQAQELRRATDQTQTWGRGARGRRARATPAAGAGQSSTPFFFWKGLLFIARASRIYLQRPGARPRGHGELLKLLEPSRSCQCPVQTQVFRWDFR